MEPPLVVLRPGPRPKHPRSWIEIRRRQQAPPQGSRTRSTHLSSTTPEAVTAPWQTKTGGPVVPPRRRSTADRLLYRGITRDAPPPWPRHRRRSKTPTRRGRVQEDLFRRDVAAAVSAPSPGNPNLDNLELNLRPRPPAGKGQAVSATSRRLSSHRRQRRPLAPPAGTGASFSASLNSSDERVRERRGLFACVFWCKQGKPVQFQNLKHRSKL